MGQADTVEGELLRAVEKLRDEAARNGNGNWDVGFEILLKYLMERLDDEKVFSSETLLETRTMLSRLEDYDHPYLEDDLYDSLGDRVVEYFRFYGSQVHVRNPDLYR